MEDEKEAVQAYVPEAEVESGETAKHEGCQVGEAKAKNTMGHPCSKPKLVKFSQETFDGILAFKRERGIATTSEAIRFLVNLGLREYRFEGSARVRLDTIESAMRKGGLM